MNALTLVFASILIFALAYRFYGISMAQKVLRLNDAIKTPAVEFADGHDYVKTGILLIVGIIAGHRLMEIPGVHNLFDWDVKTISIAIAVYGFFL